MTTKPARIVDAHVHFWDPARTDWYPYLSRGRDALNMGDVSGMARRFDVPTYLAESAGWNVEKMINVAAATGAHSIEETLELDRRADGQADHQADHHGHPDAIIGGLPPAESIADAVAALDRQLVASRFRGVRPMGMSTAPLPPPEVLHAIRERGLIFEVMTHADQLVTAAKGLEQHDGLTVVIEHTGWPRNGSEDERALWAEGIAALASLGHHVSCKLSGLAMPLGSMSVDVLRPWLEHAIEAFGVDRCFFASNFPVDGMHGTFDQLYTSYSDATAGLADDARLKLFATNAERIYRC